MDKEGVERYIDHAHSVVEASPQMDEANTKAAILQHFIDLLGWEVPQNTQLEYSVRAFGRTYKVDYALILEGAPVAFIEAKGLDTALTDDFREKLGDYLKSEEVNLGILTNGEEYEFFRRQVSDGRGEVRQVSKIRLPNLADRIGVLEAYSKDAIENDEWQKILNRLGELRSAKRILEEEKDDLATKLTEVFSTEVSAAVTDHAERQVKEMIDRVIEDIEKEIAPPEPDGPSTGKGQSGITEGPFRKGVDLEKISRKELVGEPDEKVAVFPSKKSGVDFLLENNAWGFVRISTEPDWIAMYVSEDIQKVLYVAKFESIVPADEADLARPVEEYFEPASADAQAGYDPNKKVVKFKEDSLFELEDPIPYKNKYPMSLTFATLEKLRTAGTTDDLLS